MAQSTDAATRVTLDARWTETNVACLVEASQRIGGIVALIRSIAEHTNLLALNATIEAARAGEAGRGFTVVADEVKELSNQTAKATKDIEAQIDQMQTETLHAAKAIQSVLDRVSEMDEVSLRVSHAIDEQSRTTREIAESVKLASQKTAVVPEAIRTVRSDGEQARSVADSIFVIATEVTRVSADLGNEVETFLIGIRAAAWAEKTLPSNWHPSCIAVSQSAGQEQPRAEIRLFMPPLTMPTTSWSRICK